MTANSSDKDLEQTKVGHPKDRISEGLLLFLITAFAYVAAFVYESGFCDYYRIPHYLIDIQLMSFFLFGTALIAMFFMFFAIGNLVALIYSSLSSEHSKHPYFRIIFTYVVLALLALPIFLYCKLSSASWIGIGAGALIVIATDFLPAVFSKDKKPFALRLQDSRERQRSQRDLTNLLIELVGLRPAAILLSLSFFLVIAYCAGINEARKMQDFLRPLKHPNQVVLRTYGDIMILAQIDPARRLVTKTFFIINKNQLGDEGLALNHLGQLSPSESD